MSQDNAADIDLTAYLEKPEKLQNHPDFGIDVSDVCSEEKDID
jgi:hypothetical protein